MSGTKPCARREAGFTLVELIVSIAILGILMVSLGAAFIVTIRTTTDTSDRYADSTGPKWVSVYFTPDVESVETVNPSTGPCGGSGALVTFAWTDPDHTSQTDTASYFIDGSGSSRRLIRKYCEGTLATPVERAVVVARLATPGAAVTCDGVPCGADATPATVKLDVVAPSGYSYSVEANRQVS